MNIWTGETSSGVLTVPDFLSVRQRWPKYNVPVSPLNAGYTTAGLMLRRRTPGISKERHLDIGDHYTEYARMYNIQHQNATSRALASLSRKGISPGPLISGIVSDKFPKNVKEELRKLASSVSLATSAAFAHYSAARLRMDTARTRFVNLQ